MWQPVSCCKEAVFYFFVCSAEFLGLLCFYYLCDRTNFFASSKKVITEYSHLWPHFQLFPAVNFAKMKVLIVVYRLGGLSFNTFSFINFYMNDLTLKCVVQQYSRDLFIFLYLLLVLVSALTSLKKHVDKSVASGKSILYLNRHQTEEWKGWMQVCLASWVSGIWMTKWNTFIFFLCLIHWSDIVCLVVEAH